MKSERVYAFVEENMKTIFAYALSRVSNKEDAEDLAGDIILAMLKSADRIKNVDALFAYVWKIADNTYKKFLRKRKNAFTPCDESILNDVADESDFISDIMHAEQLSSLRRELSLLSSEYRECTVAYYFDRLSCAEVSEKLGISLEMVKYYLFKTRKILKEGIAMEREFGEKSYKPAKFEFNTIFSGKYNREYRNLFSRKLPGNILLSAYYTPMTIRELSVELGVACAYMEDEVALLEKYGLLKHLPGGKYQTNLVIFTENYISEFRRKVHDECTQKIGDILCQARLLLDDIRNIGFQGNTLGDNKLLWPLLVLMMLRGHTDFESDHSEILPDTLYDGGKGINYGFDHSNSETSKSEISEYDCDAFAGYSELDENNAVTFADFGVLPESSRYSDSGRERMKASVEADDGMYLKLTRKQLSNVENVLTPCIFKMSELYDFLSSEAIKLMKVHAPKNVADIIDKVITKTVFFTTAGLIGKCAVDSGELSLPENNELVAAFAYSKK